MKTPFKNTYEKCISLLSKHAQFHHSVPPTLVLKVLIKAEAGDKKPKWFVRGNKRAEYHMHAAEETVEYLKSLASVRYEVVGGGRIKHDGANIHIYGHSYGFPWKGDPQHDVSAKVVQLRYPEASVTTSDDGY